MKSSLDANRLIYDFFATHRLPEKHLEAAEAMILKDDVSTWESRSSRPVVWIAALALLCVLVVVLALKAPSLWGSYVLLSDLEE